MRFKLGPEDNADDRRSNWDIEAAHQESHDPENIEDDEIDC